MAPNAVVDLV